MKALKSSILLTAIFLSGCASKDIYSPESEIISLPDINCDIEIPTNTDIDVHNLDKAKSFQRCKDIRNYCDTSTMSYYDILSEFHYKVKKYKSAHIMDELKAVQDSVCTKPYKKSRILTPKELDAKKEVPKKQKTFLEKIFG